MPDHVLVPVDGSDHAVAGLEYSLASFPDARITVCHVVDPGRDDAISVAETASPVERAERRGRELLEETADRVDDRGRDLETVLATGSPHTEILTLVTDRDVDHVVLGSHGESPISRPFLGRVSEAVVGRSPVSTTLVPEPADALAERELPGSILVPVDGSEQSEAALAYALEAFPDGSHTALHALSIPIDRTREATAGTYVGEVIADREERANEILASAEAIADERGVEIRTETSREAPEHAIVERAASEDVDQIVMGTHGRSLAVRLFTGSVAERVARRSPRTVTLVKGAPVST